MHSRLENRPRYIVYKSPRIQFEPDGQPTSPQDRRALESVLTEVHALLHPPLRNYKNIIDLLGVAWGSNHANPFQQLPVLIVEYGDRGTLADVQLNKDALSERVKAEIAIGIARGLEALHDESIVHGDLNSENIIMCTDEENNLTPKLADFGFAVIDAAGIPDVMLAGTRTWRAPESYSRLAISMIKYTDIYSFGLVVWSIALDGENPFRVLLSKSLQLEERLLAQDQSKAQDKLRSFSNFERWLRPWHALKHAPACEFCDSATNDFADLSGGFDGHSQICDKHTASINISALRQEKFYCILEDVLNCTLSVHPLERDLSQAMKLCEIDLIIEVEPILSVHTTPSPYKSSLEIPIEVVRALTDEATCLHSVIAVEDTDESEDGPCPTYIRAQLFEGRSVEEFRSMTGRHTEALTIHASDPSLGNITRWSTIFFQLEYGTLADSDLTFGTLEMVYSIQEGYGLVFNIAKRRQRLPCRVNRTTYQSALTWELQFDRERGQRENIPRIATAVYSSQMRSNVHEQQDIPPNRTDWKALGYKAELYSWQSTRDLDPGVQHFVANSLTHMTGGSAYIALCALHVNGYGMSINIDRGLDYLIQSAQLGHAISQANVYRVFTALQRDLPPHAPVEEWLDVAAQRGSRMALQDLFEINPKEAKITRRYLRGYTGGVGAVWYEPDQWFSDLNPNKLRDHTFEIDTLRKFLGVPVNRRGDGILHAAAANDARELIQSLLENCHFDVNSLNKAGETALLCAARSGHALVVGILVAHGADASMSALNGETPLHWLVSFAEPEVVSIGYVLIEDGHAKVDAHTTTNISHSRFPSTIDVDFQVPGTPLQWATRNNRTDIVKFLLSAGSDPLSHSLETPIWYPLSWAATMHHFECLDMMLSEIWRTLKRRNAPPSDYPMYSPLIRGTIHSSDTFSMILRNGESYLVALKGTLRVLYYNDSWKPRFLGGENGYDTPIGYAVSEAYDEATKILLELGWGIEDVNRPHIGHGRTPLLDAMRLPLPKTSSTNKDAIGVLYMSLPNIDAGVPIDGLQDPDSELSGHVDAETPFYVAVRKNAFKLADLLLSKGARTNALSSRSSLLISDYLITGLGHIIALNPRYSIPSIRYLRGPHMVITRDSTSEAAEDTANAKNDSPDSTPLTVNFIVDPTRCLTALHFCAMVPSGLHYTAGGPLLRTNFDFETNAMITHELLDWFGKSEYLEERCTLQGRTALHLAAHYGNVGVLRELVVKGADVAAVDGKEW